jgi:TPR repeat protein
MFRLGLAEIDGSLGLSRNVKDGEKWLKRSAVAATPEYPHALHELGLLHERGLDDIIFKDTQYSTKLYARAAQLGYAPSAYRLGECFEFGYLGCRKDAGSSMYYYNIAARQGDANACFALSAWHLVGDLPRVPISEKKALFWAKLAAEQELPKAEFALGYFAEAGIGGPKNKTEALEWYQKAAKHGDEQARKRIPVVTSSLNANTSSPHLNLPSSLVAGEAR